MYNGPAKLSHLPDRTHPPMKTRLASQVVCLFTALLVAGCDDVAPQTAPKAASLSSAAARPTPVQSQPVSPEAGLPQGTVVITSQASQQATPEQRKAVVDRLLAPANAPTASTGLSPDAACQAVKQAVKGRYPNADPKIVDKVVDMQHKEVVILSRRSNGAFDSEYYMKKVNERLDEIMARYPTMSGAK
jgi:hypothetical protein